MIMAKILELDNFHFYYGQIHALKGISLNVNEGEIVALIGGNGAGKTTTLRSISGLLGSHSEGDIVFKGVKINNNKPHAIAKMGLCQVLKGRHVFTQLTIKENLILGGYLRKTSEVEETLQYVFELFPQLKEREKQMAGTLSGGEQQMLAVGRALMSKPQLLMMDEPSLGLAPIIVGEIFATISKINKDGMPILLVEQNSKAALKIAHRAYVLETGETVLSGSAAALLDNEQVKKSYLGE
jgi:branched-chain amino acid transport system ATP-binding protein